MRSVNVKAYLNIRTDAESLMQFNFERHAYIEIQALVGVFSYIYKNGITKMWPMSSRMTTYSTRTVREFPICYADYYYVVSMIVKSLFLNPLGGF